MTGVTTLSDPAKATRRDYALELRSVGKSYGGVQAVADVSFGVRPGEVLALVGDNGAGKSTTIKIIAGIVTPDAGQIRCGEPVRIGSPVEAMKHGIQTVYQDLALCDNLDTVQNLFLGRELHASAALGGRLRRAAMEARAREILTGLGVVTLKDLSVPVGSLSGGQRQSVAICRAVLSDPKVVLLDEPTAALGVAQRRQVLELIDRLRQQGRAVIVVSHDLGDVKAVADRVVVLRLGRCAAEFEQGAYTRDQLVQAITGLEEPDDPAAPDAERATATGGPS